MNPQSKSSQESKSDYWQQHIKTCKRSGLSQKQYCRSRSLALSTFGYWKRRLNNPHPKTPRFFPLTIPAPPLNPSDAGLMLLVGSKQFKIEIKEGFFPITLKKLIATLEQL